MMTRRWATDSMHMIHSGGMYWSAWTMQDTCTSAKIDAAKSVLVFPLLLTFCMIKKFLQFGPDKHLMVSFQRF